MIPQLKRHLDFWRRRWKMRLFPLDLQLAGMWNAFRQQLPAQIWLSCVWSSACSASCNASTSMNQPCENQPKHKKKKLKGQKRRKREREKRKRKRKKKRTWDCISCVAVNPCSPCFPAFKCCATGAPPPNCWLLLLFKWLCWFWETAMGAGCKAWYMYWGEL